MAEKKTKKTTAKKTTVKKTVDKKIENTVVETTKDEMEVALDAIEEGAKEVEQIEEDIPFGKEEVNSWKEIEDFKEVEQDPPLTNLDAEIEGVDEANLNAMRKEYEVKEEVDVMNGDPSVVTTVDEIEEEAMAETFKENKKNNRIIDRTFGYSWNGMEIDYIL